MTRIIQIFNELLFVINGPIRVIRVLMITVSLAL